MIVAVALSVTQTQVLPAMTGEILIVRAVLAKTICTVSAAVAVRDYGAIQAQKPVFLKPVLPLAVQSQ